MGAASCMHASQVWEPHHACRGGCDEARLRGELKRGMGADPNPNPNPNHCDEAHPRAASSSNAGSAAPQPEGEVLVAAAAGRRAPTQALTARAAASACLYCLHWYVWVPCAAHWYVWPGYHVLPTAMYGYHVVGMSCEVMGRAAQARAAASAHAYPCRAGSASRSRDPTTGPCRCTLLLAVRDYGPWLGPCASSHARAAHGPWCRMRGAARMGTSAAYVLSACVFDRVCAVYRTTPKAHTWNHGLVSGYG